MMDDVFRNGTINDILTYVINNRKYGIDTLQLACKYKRSVVLNDLMDIILPRRTLSNFGLILYCEDIICVEIILKYFNYTCPIKGSSYLARINDRDILHYILDSTHIDNLNPSYMNELALRTFTTEHKHDLIRVLMMYSDCCPFNASQTYKSSKFKTAFRIAVDNEDIKALELFVLFRSKNLMKNIKRCITKRNELLAVMNNVSSIREKDCLRRARIKQKILTIVQTHMYDKELEEIFSIVKQEVCISKIIPDTPTNTESYVKEFIETSIELASRTRYRQSTPL